MQLPKFHETFIPILKVLVDEDEIYNKDLKKKVYKKFYSNIPENLLQQKTKSGINILEDRIGWGYSYLKMGKFVIYPKRGFIKITKKGREIAKKGNFTIFDLKNDAEFQNYQNNKLQTSDKKDNDILDESPLELIENGISNIETQTKIELLERLKDSDPYFFEKIVLKLLEKMGYGEFFETSKSKDGGIDGIINEDKLGLEKIYIQAKRYTENKVRELDIRNFIGAMSGDTKKGVFITTSTFDNLAIQKANNAHHKIILIDGSKLVDLMYEYNVGIQVKTTYEIKELDNDFFEE
ncbi:type IV methyl-directed restriction enzyme Mrr [Campylobacter blaseri]|uniref:Restriction endonuclease n=1 Tax=Campylobacter blaseri TaxID=2042961 RepID=A0A2P8R400_9BACT|nr:restriction endonuclease [Campylobacter blaseri]PSM53205.1 restriction endonuclease [Campylobacter blaseri]PSM54671.1 restriction endonuclease [Campylobacter blaseri]QKF86852.1 type IV methyl-directed restriction enzyme Mrr [Campylobacter blaseri]